MPDPEARAREDIDRQLEAAGWIVQDRNQLNIHDGPGVAVREVSIPGAGEADDLPGGRAERATNWADQEAYSNCSGSWPTDSSV